MNIFGGGHPDWLDALAVLLVIAVALLYIRLRWIDGRDIFNGW